MDGGYVKVYRNIKYWKFYKNIKVFKAFMHCLLQANYKDKNFEGVIIARGSFLTGRKKFGEECGLTEQETRSSWKSLKQCHELTIKSTKKGTLIIVEKYEEYQPLLEQLTNTSTNDLTNKQPTDNQQITTTNNIKNINNINVCNNVRARECHLNLEFKQLSCLNCAKRNQCNKLTNPALVLERGTLEEIERKRNDLYNEMILNNEIDISLEQFSEDYDWLNE